MLATASDLDPDATAFHPRSATPPAPIPPPQPDTPAIIAAVHELTSRTAAIATAAGLNNATDTVDAVTNSVAAKLISLSPDQLADDDVLDYIVTAFVDAAPALSISDGRAPASIAKLMTSDDSDEWITALLAELYQLLDKYKTFRPATRADMAADRRAGRTVRIVPMKWVLVYKFNGLIFNRRKARLVAAEAKGRFDVPDTWSPTVAQDSVRLLFVLAAINRMKVVSLDVAGAYLLGERKKSEDAVYLRLPQGLHAIQAARKKLGLPHDPRLDYTTASGDDMFWYCERNLYGLQSAGQTFWYVARDWLLSPTMGFKQSDVDPCIFYLRRDGGPVLMIIGLYVDDGLHLFADDDVEAWYMAEFEKFFDQSPDSGDEHTSFLSIDYEVSDDRSRISLNTPKLWGKLDDALAGVDLPPAATPLPPNVFELLDAPEHPVDNPLVDRSAFHLRSVLGIAAWGVQAVRPACAFAMAVIARYAIRPTRNVVNVLLHACSYLLDHRDDRLHIDANIDDKWRTYVDSSWANDPSSMRSYFGYCLVWAGCPFSFRSKLEPCVTLATRDAECVAAVYAVKAMLGFLLMLHELGFAQLDDDIDILPLELNVDNMSTVDGSHSDKVHKDSRHMGMRLKWLRQMVRDGLVKVIHIATGDNLSDVFTKPLSPTEHARFTDLLMNGAISVSLLIPHR
jgi:hypothetical protein